MHSITAVPISLKPSSRYTSHGHDNAQCIRVNSYFAEQSVNQHTVCWLQAIIRINLTALMLATFELCLQIYGPLPGHRLRSPHLVGTGQATPEIATPT